MSNATMDRIKEADAKEQLQHAEDFRVLAREIATGKEPTAERRKKVLERAGKNVEDLGAAVGVYAERARIIAQIKGAETMIAKRPEIQKKIADADAVFSRATAIYQDVTDPLLRSLTEIDRAESERSDLRQSLQTTCTDPTLLDRLRAARENAAGAKAEIDRLVPQINRRREGVARAENKSSDSGRISEHDIAERNARGRKIVAVADDAAAKLPQAEKAHADAQAEEREVLDAMTREA